MPLVMVAQLPAAVEAENWWHLCAKVGLREPVARLYYEEARAG